MGFRGPPEGPKRQSLKGSRAIWQERLVNNIMENF